VKRFLGCQSRYDSGHAGYRTSSAMDVLWAYLVLDNNEVQAGLSMLIICTQLLVD
jgi:hypothetical protein